jgi:hypothetical protein
MCGHTGPGESPLAQGELIHVIKVSVNNAVVTGTSQRAYRRGWCTVRAGLADGRNAVLYGRNGSQAYRTGGAGVPYVLE